MVAGGAELVRRLIAQVSAPVRFDLCLRTLADRGVTSVIELPPAGTLAGLVKRELPGVAITKLTGPDGLAAARDLLDQETDPERGGSRRQPRRRPASGGHRMSDQLRGARLLGIGAHRPARIVTNDDLAQTLDTNDEWIRSRVGIASRLIAAEDETVADMGVIAGGKALAAAGVEAADVDLVLLASCSLTTPIPGRAPEVAARLGAGGGTAGAVDLNGACAGFCYAVSFAADAIRVGSANNVLIVASERLSDYTDWTDRGTAVIFADGAGAAVVGPADVNEIGRAVWGSDGSRASAIETTKDDPFMRMEGQAVFRWATALAPAARQACERPASSRRRSLRSSRTRPICGSSKAWPARWAHRRPT